MISNHFIEQFTKVAKSPDPDLAPAALFIAKIEYPQLDASFYIEKLDQMGNAALERLGPTLIDKSPLDKIEILNQYLYYEQGFAGNKSNHDDLRNSFLNEVLDRKTGIPITLALVYIEIARRAGVLVDGVNFPGHFLLRLQQLTDTTNHKADLIFDPFNGGDILSETDCQQLLLKHLGKEANFNQKLLIRATKQQILTRMLVNLKRIYIGMRSFPQGLAITKLLLALNPSSLTELRDRGLMAYHLNNFSSALRDLESYLRLTSSGKRTSTVNKSEHEEIWEHVKTLRRRIARLN